MNRDEALEKFRNAEAENIFAAVRKEYYFRLIERKEEFAERLIKGLHILIDELEKKKSDFAISCIHFSFLRVHITDGTYQWMAEAQDEKGVFTKKDVSILFSMRDFFEMFENCREKLYMEAAKYVNILTPSDCDELILQEFTKQVPYLYILGIYAFRDIEYDEGYKKLVKTDVLRVTLGERRDKSFIIHMSRKQVSNSKEVLEKLTETPSEDDYMSKAYVMQDFSGYRIDKSRIAFRNLVFGNFRKCIISGSEILCCKCMSTDWRECYITDSSVDLCSFQNSDFTGVHIINSSMAGCRFEVSVYSDEIQNNIAMIPVSFRNAVIKDVDFTGSDMSGCDFRGARLDNVSFNKVELRGARFDACAKEQILFSEQQTEMIQWETCK